MSLATEFITLDNGVKICAPADIRLMTNYVLKEQGDWFEDEVAFVREYIKPDMNALDIGANYGLYSTTIAKAQSSQGKLWCFEPTPNTAAALRSTISENSFSDHVEIIEAGLSKEAGEATFYMSPNAELNSLTPEPGMDEVTITLRTLDECAKTLSWPKIDFIKLDAEGEEVNILEGGNTFFSEQSPLVMFELKHKHSINMPLIDAFISRGYEPYYLVPGLNVLAPFDTTQNFDGFLLNLFAVKNDRVEELKGQGVLVSSTSIDDTKAVDSFPKSLKALPCYQAMESDLSAISDLDADYKSILLSCAGAQDETLSIQARFDQLSLALELTKTALQPGKKSNPARLSTLARVAYDSGYRSVGNQVLMVLLEQFIKPSKTFGLSEAFVPLNPGFEELPADGKTDMWFCAMVLDQLTRKQSYSSFFKGAAETMKYVEVMEKVGFVKPDMLRRAETIEARVKAG